MEAREVRCKICGREWNPGYDFTKADIYCLDCLLKANADLIKSQHEYLRKIGLPEKIDAS